MSTIVSPLFQFTYFLVKLTLRRNTLDFLYHNIDQDQESSYTEGIYIHNQNIWAFSLVLLLLTRTIPSCFPPYIYLSIVPPPSLLYCIHHLLHGANIPNFKFRENLNQEFLEYTKEYIFFGLQYTHTRILLNQTWSFPK